MYNSSVVEGLENQIKDAKEQIERAKSARRLWGNKDFKKLILEGFCRDDCARFASQSADPALAPEQQRDALNLAQAGGHLRRFLSAQMQLGGVAEREMTELEESLEEARIEADTPDEPNGEDDQD